PQALLHEAGDAVAMERVGLAEVPYLDGAAARGGEAGGDTGVVLDLPDLRGPFQQELRRAESEEDLVHGRHVDARRIGGHPPHHGVLTRAEETLGRAAHVEKDGEGIPAAR